MTNIPNRKLKKKTDHFETKVEFINGFIYCYHQKRDWIQGPCNQTSAALDVQFFALQKGARNAD